MISPLFNNNNFISNCKEKSEFFSEHFSKQCSLIQNRSTVPSSVAPLTHKSLLLFQFSANDIKSVINKSHPEKAHDQDMISIDIIRFCGGFYLQTSGDYF